jgi:hypothetical protein
MFLDVCYEALAANREAFLDGSAGLVIVTALKKQLSIATFSRPPIPRSQLIRQVCENSLKSGKITQGGEVRIVFEPAA